MKNLLLAAALSCAPVLAFAQTYPSPTFNSVTLQNPLTVANGGTGGNTAATARTNLGAAASGVNSDITSLNQSSSGQFYQNLGANVNRIQDRLFVGEAAANLGTNVASQPDWLTQYQIAKGRTYGYVQTSTLAVENTNVANSETPFVSGAQVGTQAGGAQPIAITGIGVNNGTSGVTQAWGLYPEGYRDTSGSGTGGAYGLEADTMNYVGVADSDPYQQNASQTITAQLAAGGGYSPTGQFPSTAAINIQNNGATYDKGIVFGANALTEDNGTTGTAIAIALGHGQELQWYGAANTATASILGNGTTASGSVAQVFNDNQIEWLNASGTPLFLASNNSGAVNFAETTNATTGNPPTIAAQGSDTNILLLLAGKGTGGVAIQGNTSGVAAPAGYVGEKQFSGVPATTASLTSGVSANVTSVTLSPGDWYCDGRVSYDPASTTNLTAVTAWINSVSATSPNVVSGLPIAEEAGISVTGNTQTPILNMSRGEFNITSSTVVYLGASAAFTASTLTAGGAITCTRAR
jgi:hypothetical protein